MSVRPHDAAPTSPEGDDAEDNRAHVLERIETLLHEVSFPLDTLDADQGRTILARVNAQLRDYVIPRFQRHDAPLLLVVAGSTGAGKSTLINSMLGAPVTSASALRPTTRHPVLVCRPEDTEWFLGPHILPSLPRARHSAQTTGSVEGEPGQHLHRELRVVSHEALPSGIALLDSPDLDSFVDTNRELAAQLMNAADMWLFVTTAARYADAVPWDALDDAAATDRSVAVVVNRVDSESLDVVDDLRGLLDAHGHADAVVHVIEEEPIRDGMVSVSAIAPVSHMIARIGADALSRHAVMSRTHNGALHDLAAQLGTLANVCDTQGHVHHHLRSVIDMHYAAATERITELVSDGALLRGDVLARWQDLVGAGTLMRALDGKVQALRDTVSVALWRRPAARRVTQAATDTITQVTLHVAGQAAHRTFFALHHDPAGRSLVTDDSLARASSQLPHHIARELHDWHDTVTHLLLAEGGPRKKRARIFAAGTNTLGAALIIVVFASTGGLTGAEVGIAGGTAIIAQRVLESVFGVDAVRELARQASKDLLSRIERLLDEDASRFRGPLEDRAIDPAHAVGLRQCAHDLRAVLAAPQAPPAQGSTSPAVVRGKLRGCDEVIAGVSASAQNGKPEDPDSTVTGQSWWSRLFRGGGKRTQ